jgi:sporulation protein YabP
MPVEEKKVMKMQNVILENRGKLNVSGVVDVLNFDDQTITIDTELGLLIVKGTDLRLNKFNLDNTELIVEGEINSLIYNDKGYGKKGESILTKIFK